MERKNKTQKGREKREENEKKTAKEGEGEEWVLNLSFTHRK